MDDIQEQQDVSKEISDLISNPTFGDTVDEDELLAELEELEQEEVADKLLEIPSSTDDLPTVPTTTPVAAKKKTEDDSDLAALQQWAS